MGLVAHWSPMRGAPRRSLHSLQVGDMSSMVVAATEAVKVEAVGPEIYGPIFTAGIGIVGIAIFGAAVVAFIIDATDSYESRAEDFRSTGLAQIEKEFRSKPANGGGADLRTEAARAAPDAAKEVDPEDLYND